ncbi:retron Ec67 family RNA-directed DNA polymerase/endonuclease [Undibacterium sp. Jales W-56]|uniref:retron Ec67 family RNA-directed DNA polymerase/endonuclease n=1 Tax=Undibacterium sp. Jales W-56 TaxID=2897325 RepID=UPI0021CDFE32|nr:retron Ec67 family RNA-directed DNA polymerase/endonuclease [Undibacterium sp. Jales W-56]MCU6435610.1 retron Ec67 family RNA-directed DNA polymerase/endonuclease [Undibacterium sp. Jales W-56]
MRKLQTLRQISTKPELANLLGVKPSILTYALYVTKPEKQYIQFKIPKKSGGERIINAPTGKLKTIQSALSNLLLDCLDEINQEKYPKSEFSKQSVKYSKILKVRCGGARSKQPSLSHGFERRRSIITNALMHLGKKNVLNIDLENFFGSFNFGRVRGFFIKNENFKLDPKISTVIAQIACYNNELPQGSPCSPVITNLITHTLDIRLASLAEIHSCTYSRYADDITFSSREKIFPTKIMREDSGNYVVGKKLRSEISRSGFSINHKKTRIQFKDSRQDVTGLIVNNKPNTKREYWRTVRAQCNSLFKNGSFTVNSNGKVSIGNVNRLAGQLNFIDQLDHYNRLRQKPPLDPNYQWKRDALAHQNKNKQKKHLFSGREKTYSEFIFYRLFYSADKPTILTEGKTDNLYLKSAINILSGYYPKLAKTKTAKTPYELSVQFLNYSARTKFLLELHGGADYLKDFIKNYSHNFDRYKALTNQHPVIIVVDNDDGPKELINAVSKMGSAKIFPTSLTIKSDIRKSDFIHVTHNLYLVMTPLLAGETKSDIEAFFTDADRLKQHNGKCFNTKKNRKDEINLSKDSFANHIISAQKTTINFDGLKPILDRITMAIEHHNLPK